MITDDDILLMFRMTGSETDSPEAMERSRVGSVCTLGVSEGQFPKNLNPNHVALSQRVWRRPPRSGHPLRPLHSGLSVRRPLPPGLQPRSGGLCTLL